MPDNEQQFNEFDDNNNMPPQPDKNADMMTPEDGMENNGIGDFNEPDMTPQDDFEANTQQEEPMDDSTMSIINQLSDTDRKAVRAYAESMLNRDETQNQPMQESFIFTKKQLDEIHEMLMTQSDKHDNELNKINKKTKQLDNLHKSPFDSPFI